MMCDFLKNVHVAAWESIIQLIRAQWKYIHEVGLISAIKPALVSITSNTWTPLLLPQLLRGEVCPFNVGN